MPIISQRNKDKISEQVLAYLFSVSPESKFTSEIAQELVRDEEFMKSLLQGLKEKKLVIEINKNPNGEDYKRRQRWRLSNEAFEVFRKHNNA